MKTNYAELYDLYVIAYKHGYKQSFSAWLKEQQAQQTT